MAEEEHDPQFAPVHQLTDKDVIETKTLEEDEDVQFKMRAKLFRFDSSNNEWKERGTGDVRVLAHKETKKVRLVMRRDKTFKICANHYITKEMRLQPNIGSDRSWVWKVAADVSEGAPTAETLAIRFANSDNAAQFKAAFEAGQKQNAELSVVSSDSAPEPPKKVPETHLEDQPSDAIAQTEPETAKPAEDPSIAVAQAPAQAVEAEIKAEEAGESENKPPASATTGEAEALKVTEDTPAAEVEAIEEAKETGAVDEPATAAADEPDLKQANETKTLAETVTDTVASATDAIKSLALGATTTTTKTEEEKESTEAAPAPVSEEKKDE